jgi:hypothetical protein
MKNERVVLTSMLCALSLTAVHLHQLFGPMPRVKTKSASRVFSALGPVLLHNSKISPVPLSRVDSKTETQHGHPHVNLLQLMSDRATPIMAVAQLPRSIGGTRREKPFEELESADI